MLASLALTSCTTASAGPDLATEVDTGQQAFLESCKEWDEWSKPAPPFRIYGNTYYVGTCGISAILVTGDDGHMLIDGASRDGGALVEANIEKLGFRIKDVKILLHSHEHFDHVGGLAYLQERSGAQVIASHGATMALQTGEAQPDDPQYGIHAPFAPAKVARGIGGGDLVSLGKITLIPLETPGHTPGALTWSWWSCERTDCKMIVYADSLSPISSDSYRFSDHPEYVARFRKGLEALAEMPCDIVLTPHPSASRMLVRMAGNGGLVDKGGCRLYAENITARLDSRLAKEAGSE